MKFTTTLLSVAAIAASTVTAADDAKSTLTVHPNCPTATQGDVMVTRSAVVVPVCGGGNETKPMIISMSGGMTMTMTGGGPMMTPTMSGNMPEFTGAASKNALGGVVAIGGVLAALMV